MASVAQAQDGGRDWATVDHVHHIPHEAAERDVNNKPSVGKQESAVTCSWTRRARPVDAGMCGCVQD